MGKALIRIKEITTTNLKAIGEHQVSIVLKKGNVYSGYLTSLKEHELILKNLRGKKLPFIYSDIKEVIYDKL